MKQVIPFTKDIVFNTKVSEITSISLEHNYNINNELIHGNFIISGDYKIHDASIEKEQFSYEVPFDIDLTNRYEINNCTFEINDFYYEIIDNNTMRCYIEVSVDALEEKIEILEEVLEEEKLDTFTNEIGEIVIEEDEMRKEENCIEVINKKNDSNKERETEIIEVENQLEEEIVEELLENPKEKEKKAMQDVVENKANILSSDSLKKLFDEDTEEVFSTYKIYIIRENDTIETIVKKYNITKEVLSEYNDIDNIKLNDKIIIPIINE